MFGPLKLIVAVKKEVQFLIKFFYFFNLFLEMFFSFKVQLAHHLATVSTSPSSIVRPLIPEPVQINQRSEDTETKKKKIISDPLIIHLLSI